jgi:hypothetical protein
VRASLGQPEAAQAMAAVAASASPTSSQPRLPLTRANLRGHGAPLRPDIRRPRLGGSPGKPTTACTRAPIPRSLRSEVAFALGDRSSIIDGGSCPGASRIPTIACRRAGQKCRGTGPSTGGGGGGGGVWRRRKQPKPRTEAVVLRSPTAGVNPEVRIPRPDSSPTN